MPVSGPKGQTLIGFNIRVLLSLSVTDVYISTEEIILQISVQFGKAKANYLMFFNLDRLHFMV